ncbi:MULTISPECIES: TetR-like C-terminal domain-containing protein [Micrococcales]|uniref:TetR-like C-terminal domain-containing protein n=1 Tax=Micrococcales TaxID=85006 RepID=UPI0019D27A3B|nr:MULTISPECIES: TetR-like C-terminal domain-containing protein [Micrococcales]MBN6751634.1 TetR/AcrR family transcriptional regulator C-terminal ligand-binding domain-containing protein [Micrococcus luteus]MCM1014367.1 TetR/AcrR family transcriptional regulator C-terminal ligand-binding domain-containing protein [Brevibacterium sp. XM4083]MBN6761681.1 TetR/AcrR family transcriptional regulator C-terminal ligand-binding domain-containing protein [Micrococcus luteus]MBN6802732.1 TetR/AcrR family
MLAALTDPEAGFEPPTAPTTGTVAGDLRAVLTAFAAALDEPRGRALEPIMTRRRDHPELFWTVQQRVIEPLMDVILGVLRAGVERGEVDRDALTPRVAAVGLQLLVLEHMAGRTDPGNIAAMVDEILLPLTRPRTYR